MRDIDGIKRALEILEPHRSEIEAEFDRVNNEFKRLAAIDHDPMGRVLRAHLIVEVFMTTYLEHRLNAADLSELRLSFAQKAGLLPAGGDPASFIKPAIVQLNKVRNRFGHRLGYVVTNDDVRAIHKVLSVSRKGTEFIDPISAIEAFATVACAMLAVGPPHLRDVFVEAFRHWEGM